MGVPVVLAHGALGIWDEVIFLSVAAIFLAMMGISWVRSRSAETTQDDSPVTETDLPPPETPEPDHFRLE